MLICDIDGTLTDQNYAIHPAVPAALRRLEEIGIPVALATGNVRPITWGIARQLGISGPLISENGGVIWDWREDGDVVRLADGVRARAAAEWLATRMDGFDASGIESNAWRESEWCLHTSENDNEMRRLLGDSEWSDLSIVRTGFAIHLADQALHKGNGVARALVMRGIDAGDVVAVGDAPNDIPMFELVGFSAAVGNAFEATKSAADIIIDAPNGAAVAMLVDAIIEHIKNEK
jgi:phosphoglycolate phosphatase (TIGR01487 family)